MADLDSDFAALAAAAGGKSSAAPSRAYVPNATYDPSSGGSTLQVGPWDTGLRTPQWLDRGLSGAGQGMTDILRHAGNLMGLQSDQQLQDAKALDAPLMDTTAGKVGNFIGTSAALAPIGMGAGAGLARMGALGARLAASPLASGAIQGAAQGALMADPGQRGQGALLGGALGGALPAAGGLIGKVARGMTRTPAAQTLLDEGISLTPGQMNPTGVANRMEQAVEGAFGVGDMVQNARENAMQQYNRAMVERSMAPGAKLPANVHDFNDMIDKAAESFDNAYDVGKGFPVGAKIMTNTGTDVPLSQALKPVLSQARPGITASDQKAISNNVQALLNQTVAAANRNGGMKSDDLLDLRSTLRDLVRGETGTDNASRARRAIYQDAASQVGQALESQLPKSASDALRAADQQYAKFAIIRNAAKAAKDAPGGPTPFQVSSAVAKATPPNLYARGGGLNRDLSKAAREVFQSNVPRTGLAGVGRLALTLAAAAGPTMTHPLIAGPALGGMAALTLTPWGRAAAAGNTAVQRALGGGLDRIAGMVPGQVKNLPGLYGRSGLLALLGSPLQQMPPDGPSGQ